MVVKPSTRPEKKLMAIFTRGKEHKTVHFGARGMSDYTIHKDKARRDRYDARHRRNEYWSDPFTAGALSKYILWDKPTRSEAIRAYKKRFHLK